MTMRLATSLHALALVAAHALAVACDGQPSDPPGVEPAGRISHEPLDELSGFARSAAHPGIFWAHNDSGDPARVFALRADGSVHVPRAYAGKKAWPGTRILGAENVDWEDATLAEGLLYVADMGNNSGARRDLGVYVIEEPSPDAEAVRALRFIPVVYRERASALPQDQEVDCEAVFADRGALYFLTKSRGARDRGDGAPGSRLYRLRTFRSDRENTLERVSAHPELARVTGAGLSPNGAHLAVLSSKRVWIFERPVRGDDWLAGAARTIELPQTRTMQAEAIAWIDDGALLIGSEDRALLRASLANAKPHAR